MREGRDWVLIFQCSCELFSKEVIAILLLLLRFLDHVFLSRGMLQITYWVEIQETESLEGVVVSPGSHYIVLHAALCNKY